ncbi:MAG: hypothetical protein SVW02_02385, partial [Candidatus Nanohaloarchaea archaeon]|nr:hypothetical protein [Candidatus Nanohaloarchaea archaeon]
PASRESVLTVESGSLSAAITPAETEVLEGATFDVRGEVTCNAVDGCSEVTLTVEKGGGTALGSGTTPFATSGNNPKSCGNMNDGGSCSKTWTVEATGDGTSDYGIQVTASSSDSGISDDTATDTVTIEAPSVSISGISAGGSSTGLEAGFDYSS